MFGVSVRTVERMIERREVDSFRIAGQRRIPATEIRRILKQSAPVRAEPEEDPEVVAMAADLIRGMGR